MTALTPAQIVWAREYAAELDRHIIALMDTTGGPTNEAHKSALAEFLWDDKVGVLRFLQSAPDEISRLSAEVERLREALTPFAEDFDRNDCETRDDDDALEVSIRDLRQAYAAINSSVPSSPTKAVEREEREWQPIESAPTGEDDFYLVCCADPRDDRSPFVVRGSIFASARKHPPMHHLSMAYLTHWQRLPAKPVIAAIRALSDKQEG